MSTTNHRPLADDHTPKAIRKRLAAATRHSYVGDFVLGAIDGAVTTFAVVAGVAGADLGGGVAVVLGLANLAADGFSMAASNFASTRSEHELLDQLRRMEEQHIARVPEGEREEIRQIFAAKGFEGPVLEEVVAVITADRKRWVDTMVTEEFGHRLESPSPWKAGAATFAAFILAGLVPLSPLALVQHTTPGQTFAASSLLTAATFFLIGLAKGRVVQRPMLYSGLETLVIGGAAASLAYLVGVGLKGLAGA
jgi:VIT1/CCC1 family predicted Fe2+/Mn2+ transporter